jgi:phosphinothricin acetyltransferase
MTGAGDEDAQRPLVRDAGADDIAAIQAIYAHHVTHGLASFEVTPPDAAEMARRLAAIVDHGLPYLTAEVEGRIKGFAYAGPYRSRSGYRYSVENSVYVDPDAMRLGIGRALLGELIERCQGLGYRQMIAVIGDTGNTPSIDLHAKMGFQQAGNIRSVGFKLGQWVDSVIMQRPLGDGGDTLPGD